MERKVVCLSQQIIHCFHFLNAVRNFLHFFGGNIRIIGNDTHIESAAGHGSQAAANTAQSHKAQSLASNIVSQVLITVLETIFHTQSIVRADGMLS